MNVRYFNLATIVDHKRSLVIWTSIFSQITFIIMENIMSKLSIRQYIKSIEFTKDNLSGAA